MPCQGPYGGGYGGGNDYHADYLEAERRLCEARWLILRLIELSPVAAVAKRIGYNDLIKKHTQQQLDHRRGDKKHVIERINATIDRVRNDMAEIVRCGGIVGEGLINQEKKLKEERTRILAITDEQLLADYWGTEKRLTSDLVDHE